MWMLGQPGEPNVDPLANLLKGMFHMRFSDVCAELNGPYIWLCLMITALIVEFYAKRSKHLISLTFMWQSVAELTKLFMLVYVIQVDRAGKCATFPVAQTRHRVESSSPSKLVPFLSIYTWIQKSPPMTPSQRLSLPPRPSARLCGTNRPSYRRSSVAGTTTSPAVGPLTPAPLPTAVPPRHRSATPSRPAPPAKDGDMSSPSTAHIALRWARGHTDREYKN